MNHETEMIVIGASAGGVEALVFLLGALPRGFHPAVAIALHIPADSQSLLPKLLAERCSLPVKEVEDKEPIAPGAVYIAAPDYHMLIEPDKSFALSRDDAVNFSRPSIDVLFESAAAAYQRNLLGIILTGASADGAQGLKAVRDYGGQAWVQHPDEAKARIMPTAAIDLAGADRILTLAAMGGMLRDSQLFSSPERKSDRVTRQ